VGLLRRPALAGTAGTLLATEGAVKDICPCCHGLGFIPVYHEECLESPPAEFPRCTHCMGEKVVPIEVDVDHGRNG